MGCRNPPVPLEVFLVPRPHPAVCLPADDCVQHGDGKLGGGGRGKEQRSSVMVDVVGAILILDFQFEPMGMEGRELLSLPVPFLW